MKKKHYKNSSYQQNRPLPLTAVSESQYRLIIKIVTVCEVPINEVNNALLNSHKMSSFISKWKPEYEAALTEQSNKAIDDELLITANEENIINIVKFGICPDIVANLRGACIVHHLGLKENADGKYDTADGPKSIAGLYRSVVRAIIEGKEGIIVTASTMAQEAQNYIDRYPELRAEITEITMEYLRHGESNGFDKDLRDNHSAALLELVENRP